MQGVANRRCSELPLRIMTRAFLLLGVAASVTLFACGEAGPTVQDCVTAGTTERLPPIEWRVSLANGSRDALGAVISATEVRSFAALNQRLFAAQGIWMDPDDATAEQPGPQILVLDRSESKGGRWRVDFELTDRLSPSAEHRYITFSTMRAIRFERDWHGVPLRVPVSLLIAGVWDRLAEMNVFVRDTSGRWEKILVEPGENPPQPNGCHHHVRSFLLHRDTITGADLVFAGTNAQGAGCPTRIYRGAYDGQQLVWSPVPETWIDGPAPDDRVTSMTTANGKAYATACGKVFERTDGAAPMWSRIYVHPDDNCPAGPGENGFRGATPIAGPQGDSLLLAMEGWRAHIGVLDLLPAVTWKTEMDTNTRLRTWLRTPIGYSIVAYDGMTRFRRPACEGVTLMGLEANTPFSQTAWHGWAPEAFYLVRYDDGSYENRRVQDHTLTVQPPLVAVRTMIASPFAADGGRVIYAGGFDANHVSANDTGWLYRGTLQRMEPVRDITPGS